MRKYRREESQKTAILLTITLAMITILLVIGKVSLGMASTTDEAATDSAIPEEEIKENLKDRLEKAIKEKPEMLLKRAWIGTLDSIANHTLTIETRDGPRLASVSAETTYLRLPKRDVLKLADLELGSYTVAMGYLNGNQVLNTLRVIVEKESPKPSDRQAQFLTILSFDPKQDILEGELPSGETLSADVTPKTTITTATDGSPQKATSAILQEGRLAVAILKTETKNKETSETLLHIHVLREKSQESSQATSEKEATPSERPKELDSSPAATE